MRMTVCLAAVAVVLSSGISGRAQETPASPASINSSSNAAVPRLIRFSGTLRQVGEKPARGVVELSFSLFKEEAGGEPLWFESQTVEVDAQGRYNVLLGAMHPDGLPMDVFTSGEARWLSIMVGKSEQPRVLLVSVPYALKAADAESLGGKPATAYVASDQLKSQVESSLADSKIGLRTLNSMVMASSGGSDTPPALVNETVPATFTCTAAGNCVTVTQNGTGNTLFATQTAGSGTGSAVRAETASPSGRPIFGWAKSTTGLTYGVWGQSASVDGAGVFGSATSATGQTYGVWGQSASVSGAGLYGSATAATGTTYGIFGSSTSTAGVGIRAQAMAATGNTMGLRALVNSAAGTAGVFDNLAGGKLISARTTGLVEKFSVLANGSVTAAGSVSAGGSVSASGSISAGAAITSSGSVTALGPGSFQSNSGIFSATVGTNSGNGTIGYLGISTIGIPTGVYGTASSSDGRGVIGRNLSSFSRGELGTSVGADAAGVYGKGGVYGVYGDGSTYGVYGLSGGSGGNGVYGYNTSYGSFGGLGSGWNGVYAYGSLYGVYASAANSQIGVYASTLGGYGVFGLGDNGVRGEGNVGISTASGVVGIGSYAGYGVYGQGGAYGVYSAGDFAASGSKSAVVALQDNRVVELYAVESPEVWFEDFGTATLRGGAAEVAFEPTFALTVNAEAGYHVFLTPNGDSNGLYVFLKSPNGFQIREARGGRSDITVDYRIVARRRGFENVRLQEVDADEEAIAEIHASGRARKSRPVLRVPKKRATPDPRGENTPTEAAAKALEIQGR